MTAVVNKISAPHRHFHQLFSKNTDAYNISFMNGLAGATLVSAHLGRALSADMGAVAGAEMKQMSKVLHDRLLGRLQRGDLKITSLHSLCSGLAGVIYVLDELKREGFSEHSLERATRDSLTELLLKQSLQDFDQRNTDFLHGPLGVFFVLLKDMHHAPTKEALDQIFDRYQEQLVTDHLGSRIYNSVLEGQREADEYNFGLAHGMSGHIALWTEAHARGFRPQETEQLVTRLLQYIDHYRVEPGAVATKGSHKYYPKSVIENNEEAWKEIKEETYNSRLGWCYGDINIAFAKIKAGKVFGRQDWWNDGLNLARHVATRLDPADAQISTNAFFCHGAAGLVYMFGLLHQATGENLFLTARKNYAEYYKELWQLPKYTDLKLHRPASFLDGIPGAVLGTLSEIPGGGYPLADAFLLKI
ncbi:MAG: lantibiotic modifying enzyme [Neolewinella sp.]|jgi:lantibiotic modifying enzyme